jgi:hypothetical protein
MSQEILFSKYDIFGVLEAQKELVKRRVQEIPADKGTRQIRVILYAKEASFRISVFAVSHR